MSLMEIARSGLIASQTALGVTSHNVANANTPGYSRQRANPVAVAGYGKGQDWGVMVQDISRVTDYYLTAQVWDASTYNSAKAVSYQNLKGLDRVLGSESTSITKGINDLFAELSAASTEPSSMAFRQEVISAADILAQRFNNLYGYMEKQGRLASNQIEENITRVNGLIASIAAHNKSVIAGERMASNEFLDVRDQAIAQLAEYVGITVLQQDDGALNVYLASGQPLVMGDGLFNSLAVRQSVQDPGHMELMLDNGNTRTVFRDNPGGEIGALLSYQQGVLTRVSNDLGRASLVLADQVNQILAGGADSNGFRGAPGSALFADINWLEDNRRVQPVTGNGVLSVAVADITALEDMAYYELRIVSATDYEIYGVDTDGTATQLVSGSDLTDLTSGVSFNGLTLKHHDETPQGGRLNSGDLYRINFPIDGTPAASRAVELVNRGDSQVLVAINDSKKLTVSDYGLQVDNGVYTLTRKTDGAAWSGAVADLDAGVSVDGFTVSVHGATLADGDRFVLQPVRQGAGLLQMTMSRPEQLAFAAAQPAGVPAAGDNSNLEKLLALRSELLIEGRSTLTEGFVQTVGYVGVLTVQAKAESEASTSLLEKATLERDGLSAVNLDEEAVNMIRFQQAYDANARVISVSRNLFDTLLAMF